MAVAAVVVAVGGIPGFHHPRLQRRCRRAPALRFCHWCVVVRHGAGCSGRCALGISHRFVSAGGNLKFCFELLLHEVLLDAQGLGPHTARIGPHTAPISTSFVYWRPCSDCRLGRGCCRGLVVAWAPRAPVHGRSDCDSRCCRGGCGCGGVGCGCGNEGCGRGAGSAPGERAAARGNEGCGRGTGRPPGERAAA